MQTKRGRVSALLLLAACASFTAREAAAQSCTKPNILVVLDISGSMNETVGGSSKYAQAVKGIDSTLAAVQSNAQFGLLLFPSPRDAGYPSSDFCNISHGLVELDFTSNARGAFSEHLNDARLKPKASYDTPLYQALVEATYPTFASVDAGIPSAVVLISDGIQDCAKQGPPQDFETRDKNADGSFNAQAMEENRSAAEYIAAYLASGRVPVYPVGFAAGVDPLTLNYIAQAAGTQRSPTCDPEQTNVHASNNCYYQANDASDLTAALSQIVRRIQEERCDGIDNDCDGRIDEDLSTTCGSCNEQICKNGRLIACRLEAQSNEDICNGRDDDCDGTIDEDALPEPCQNSGCWGQRACVNGARGVCDARSPSAELCDAVDNDCNGRTDDGLTCACSPSDAPRKCGPKKEVGVCKLGTQTCSGSAQTGYNWSDCIGAVEASDEVCNGLDDNCDGNVDNILQANLPDCTSECGPGKIACVNGRAGACIPLHPPEEVCDGKDNDCDGVVDENPTDLNCVVDKCGAGKRACTGGKLSECKALSPPKEACNGIDDNCDSVIDEGCACKHGEEKPCGNTVGTCTTGVQKCEYGQWTGCIGSSNGRKEECNGMDDDCDGMIDEPDADLCPGSQSCVCGGCADRCTDDRSCTNGGKCVEGMCQIDYCQLGWVCHAGKCEVGEDNAPLPAQAEPMANPLPKPTVRDGCTCRSNDPSAMLGAIFLFALFRGLFSRRSAVHERCTTDSRCRRWR